MAKVAREMVERAGVDVDRTLELLVKNAAAGLPTCYTILRANLIGLRGESLKEIAEVARTRTAGVGPQDLRARGKAPPGHGEVPQPLPLSSPATLALAISNGEIEHESRFPTEGMPKDEKEVRGCRR